MITVNSIADAGAYAIGLAHLRAKSRRTGQSIEMPLAELFWVVDGKIVRLLPFYLTGGSGGYSTTPIIARFEGRYMDTPGEKQVLDVPAFCDSVILC